MEITGPNPVILINPTPNHGSLLALRAESPINPATDLFIEEKSDRTR